MTDEQRQQVTNLRSAGYGYKKISQLLNLSESTVKSFCKRHNIVCVETESNLNITLCKCCGVAIRQKPKRKTKIFCSDQCRIKWWNGHLDLVNKKANYEYICPVCKKHFTVYENANRKYCSHSCYIEDRFASGICCTIRRIGTS